jgi:hypothetical protein
MLRRDLLSPGRAALPAFMRGRCLNLKVAVAQVVARDLFCELLLSRNDDVGETSLVVCHPKSNSV